MKKIFMFLCLVYLPNCAFGDMDKYTQIQMLRSQIEKLQQSRDEKYSELQQCAKDAKNFKIVAASTLSATAVGVAVNVALHKKLAALDAVMASGAGGVADRRSEKQKCLDEKAMYCNVGSSDYDAEICQLYEQEGCE